ncbi:HAD family hydrolase [Daejeonia sp. YH14]|uniref:HAD family hydrolase n=1 Tax=Daejeonia sp. YH14 TaxID=3439042 RepID=UPI003F491DC9
MRNKFIVFDLDDTLVYEIDFLKSAYLEIAKKLDEKEFLKLYKQMMDWYMNESNVFNHLENLYNVDKKQLLDIYRSHFPNIKLIDGAKEILTFCKENAYKLGLVSDGRSLTQRNKLKALGIENLFDKIVISEEFGSKKPSESNFKVFLESENTDYFYIADNPEKDFVSPNKLGWFTVCLLATPNNIHQQNFDGEPMFLPQLKVKNLIELKEILK